LARNVGASMGISFVTTGLERRGQFHRDRLAAHLDPANPRLQATLRGMAATLRAHGAPASEALRQAYGLLQGNLQRQATMLAYVDNFWVLGIATLFLMPCVLLIKKPRRGGAVLSH
jgi:MFS transporter, DHA2 family, multidrug resistance protein